MYYIVNSVEELKLYIFQPDIGYTNAKAGKSFDLIDVVLINGDFKYKPWSTENKEVGWM